MSVSDAAPLPRLGEVFFDVRGSSRTMRLSWYADTGVAVFSIWQGGMCTGTFRLPIGDLPRMIDILQRGPQGTGHGHDYGQDQDWSRPAEVQPGPRDFRTGSIGPDGTGRERDRAPRQQPGPAESYGADQPHGSGEPHGQSEAYGQEESYRREDPYGREDSYQQDGPYGRDEPYGRPDGHAREDSQDRYGRDEWFSRDDSLSGQDDAYGRPGPYGRDDRQAARDDRRSGRDDAYGHGKATVREDSYEGREGAYETFGGDAFPDRRNPRHSAERAGEAGPLDGGAGGYGQERFVPPYVGGPANDYANDIQSAPPEPPTELRPGAYRDGSRDRRSEPEDYPGSPWPGDGYSDGRQYR